MIKGTVFKYGDNVDTDVIIPARYLNNPDKSELAKHCMEDIDPNFAKNVKKGDIIVAGFNFGCGSSREHAPIAISACNVSLVIAKSFARIFYRNSINIGFPILGCEECVDNVKSGDELSVDLEKGIIIVNNSIEFKANSFPPFIQKIVEDGGLLNYIKNRKVKR